MTKPKAPYLRAVDIPQIGPASGSVGAMGGLDNGGGPPHDGDMEARIAKLEDFVVDSRERLTKIETRLDQTATKSDLHEMSGSLIKWMVGSAAGLGLAGITVMTFVLNNAIPKTPPASTAPIVIQVPAYTQQVTPPPAIKK